jgi:pimeloyl-ACP methyl ester carboxylesterase
MKALDGRPMPVVVGAEHRWVDVRGVQLHVAEVGQGRPVVLLHGLLQHWYAWRKLVPLLSGEYRLVCVDLRGFGWSEQARRGYDLASLGSDVVALLDTLGLARVDVVAHDFGAGVAFEMCLRAPHRVGNLISLNMVHPWPERRHLFLNMWRMWFTALWEYPVAGRWCCAEVIRRTRPPPPGPSVVMRLRPTSSSCTRTTVASRASIG